MATALPPVGLPVAPAEQPLWRVVAEAIRAAPPAQRRGLMWSPFPILTALVVGIIDIAAGTNPLEISRLVALVLASIGYTVLLVSHVLHFVSQNRTFACDLKPSWPFRALQSEVPDRVFQALPAMALVSAALSTAALGLYVPSLIARPLTLVVVPLFLWLLVIAFRTAVHTSRFLYGYAEQQASLAERARAEATEARLAALQAQMNPHFLFNALNTVASLVRTNPRDAEHTVEDLADVLRRTLARTSRGDGTVGEEVDYLRAYLGIEQARFADRLQVEWDVDPTALACHLPPLTLQPLVENALRHGLGSRLEPGQLRITVRRHGERLSLSVSDDGAGLPGRIVEGTGLGNLRRRLATLYGETATLSLSRVGETTEARVELPAGDG